MNPTGRLPRARPREYEHDAPIRRSQRGYWARWSGVHLHRARDRTSPDDLRMFLRDHAYRVAIRTRRRLDQPSPVEANR